MSKIDKDFINRQRFHEEVGDIGHFLERDIEYPRKLHDLHSDLPALPEKLEINKCSKFVCNFYDKKNYVVHVVYVVTSIKARHKTKKSS